MDWFVGGKTLKPLVSPIQIRFPVNCSIHPLHSMPQELGRSLTCRWNVRNPAPSTRWGSPVAENRAKMGPVVATKRCSFGVEDQQNGGHMLLQWLRAYTHTQIYIYIYDSVYVIHIEWGFDDWRKYIRPTFVVAGDEPGEPRKTGPQDARRVIQPGNWDECLITTGWWFRTCLFSIIYGIILPID